MFIRNLRFDVINVEGIFFVNKRNNMSEGLRRQTDTKQHKINNVNIIVSSDKITGYIPGK